MEILSELAPCTSPSLGVAVCGDGWSGPRLEKDKSTMRLLAFEADRRRRLMDGERVLFVADEDEDATDEDDLLLTPLVPLILLDACLGEK